MKRLVKYFRPLPILSGLIIIIVTLTLWHALHKESRNDINKVTALQGIHLKKVLALQFNYNLLLLDTLGKRLSYKSQYHWQQEITNFRFINPLFVSIHIYNNIHELQKIYHAPDNVTPTSFSLNTFDRLLF